MNYVSLSANTSWYLYNFRASTIRALQQAGYKVLCIAPDDGYGEKLMTDLDCEWINLAMDNQGNNPFADLSVFWQIFRAYRRYKPKAALHFTIKNNVYGTWAAKLLGVPALNNVSGLGTAFIHKGLVSKIVKLLYKSSFPLTHTVFCQNPEDRQLLIDHRLVPESKLVLLPGSGADIDKFQPSKKRQEQRPFSFLYAGRMLADKGLRELIEAMAILKSNGYECRLILCGFADVKNVTAISRDELARWNELANVDYIGSTDDMASVLSAADAAVLPSYREGMPKSLLEAGAMGLASVTTDAPGCRNVIIHGFNGLLCDVKNAESLALQMQNLMDLSGQERETMERNARQHIEENFSEQRVVELTMRAINQAISDK